MGGIVSGIMNGAANLLAPVSKVIAPPTGPLADNQLVKTFDPVLGHSTSDPKIAANAKLFGGLVAGPMEKAAKAAAQAESDQKAQADLIAKQAPTPQAPQVQDAVDAANAPTTDSASMQQVADADVSRSKRRAAAQQASMLAQLAQKGGLNNTSLS